MVAAAADDGTPPLTEEEATAVKTVVANREGGERGKEER